MQASIALLRKFSAKHHCKSKLANFQLFVHVLDNTTPSAIASDGSCNLVHVHYLDTVHTRYVYNMLWGCGNSKIYVYVAILENAWE